MYKRQEYDTYKVGTVANSCSTMHKIHSKPFTEEDFSFDHIMEEDEIFLESSRQILKTLNYARDRFLQTDVYKRQAQRYAEAMHGTISRNSTVRKILAIREQIGNI